MGERRSLEYDLRWCASVGFLLSSFIPGVISVNTDGREWSRMIRIRSRWIPKRLIRLQLVGAPDMSAANEGRHR
jgi:hypothetical protein